MADNTQLTTPLCSGFGQFHTNHPDAETRRPYVGTTLADIIRMVGEPQNVDKGDAQWCIPHNDLSEYGRDKQRLIGANGVKWFALWFDIDSGNHPLETITGAIQAICGNVQYVVYSSKGAKESARKWRGLIPLNEPVGAMVFEHAQARLNEELEAHGITPDHSSASANQVFYLPNKGTFYQTAVNTDAGLLVGGDFAQPYTQRLHKEQQEAEAAHAARLAEFRARKSTNPNRDAAYIEAVCVGKLQDAANRLAAAPDGGKHAALRKEAALIGGLLHFGAFSQEEAEAVLIGAIAARCNSVSQARKTAAAAMRAGEKKPISAADILSKRKEKTAPAADKTKKPDGGAAMRAAAKSSTEAPAAVAKSPTEAPAPAAKSSTEAPAAAAKSSTEAPAAVAKSSTEAPAAVAKSPTEAPAPAAKSSTETPAAAAKSPTEAPAPAAKSSTETPAAAAKSSTEAPAAAAKSSSETPAAAAKSSSEPKDDGAELPRIQTNHTRLSVQSEKAIQALTNSNAALFNQGGALFRLTEAPGLEGKKTLRLVPVDVPILRYELERAAVFYSLTKDFEEVPKPPPEMVAKDILAAPDFPDFPLLDRTVTAPCVTRNGRLIDKPGFDKSTGIYYFQAEPLRIADNRPTPDNIKRALALLSGLVIDFPFVSQADKAHALGLLLLPFVRDLIDGPTPLHFFTAPSPRTGKSLLAEVLASVSNPLVSPSAPPSGKHAEDEWRKKIASCLLSENPHIWFDNIKGLVHSEALEGALTATTSNHRALGTDKEIRLRNNRVWMATGNNAELSSDMTGRAVEIRLDANMEDPSARRGFRHPDVLQWVAKERGRFVGAALTLVNHWLQQDKPKPADSVPVLGRFESWRDVIGGILGAAGVGGFLANRKATIARVNTADDAAKIFITDWGKLLEEDHSKAILRAQALHPIAKDAGLFEDVLPAKDESGEIRRLGIWLGRQTDRVFSDWKIKRTKDPATGKPAYTLSKLSGSQGDKTEETEETGEPIIKSMAYSSPVLDLANSKTGETGEEQQAEIERLISLGESEDSARAIVQGMHTLNSQAGIAPGETGRI